MTAGAYSGPRALGCVSDDGMRQGLRYGSVCSGIEAITVAWRPLGFVPAWFAEIDPFCSALLAYRYPEVQNLGDFTRIDNSYGAIDILVGGTPCQSFSTAGRRKGLDDARGNLAIEFCRLAGRLRPRWIVWENVPGVLVSNAGWDFGAILGALAELGYGCAWRVLDAQFFGVPQRRRRVFIVGYLGDWRRAAAVLLEPESLCLATLARRKAQEVVGTITAQGVGTSYPNDNEAQAGHLILLVGNNTSEPINIATTCNAHSGSMHSDFETETFCVEVMPPLLAGPNRAAGERSASEHSDSAPRFATCLAVRRLTVRECERLQGLPDDYTLIPNYRKRLSADEVEEMAAYLGIPLEEALRVGATPDGPRYKAVGNSMAVPVMHWIGRRIRIQEELCVGCT
jgi:DNA (cytosine-5)-methyltransferase 1